MVYTTSYYGYESQTITVETDLRNGIPSIDIVGLADNMVNDTREIITQFINDPYERVLIALSPCDIKKNQRFTLPIFTSICQQLTGNKEDFFVIGEIEKDTGHIYSEIDLYTGLKAAQEQFRNFIIPLSELEKVKDMNLELSNVYAVENITQIKEIMHGKFKGIRLEASKKKNTTVEFLPLTEDIKTLKVTKPQKDFIENALVLAISGKHNLILTESPDNATASVIYHALKCLTPYNTPEENESVKRIHSLSNLPTPKDGIVIRWPHQTATIEGICGGGPNCHAGEISLSHNGILFMENIVEFRSSVIQMLRVPLESKQITLSRAGRTTVFPSNFQLIATANPCPCGNYNIKGKLCLCSSRTLSQYWKKISFPLIDRIEIKTSIEYSTEYTEIIDFELLRKKIANAIQVQRKKGTYNKDLTPLMIAEENLSQEIKDIENHVPSPRAYLNIIRLARTLADQTKTEKITLEHVKKVRPYVTDFYNCFPLF